MKGLTREGIFWIRGLILVLLAMVSFACAQQAPERDLVESATPQETKSSVDGSIVGGSPESGFSGVGAVFFVHPNTGQMVSGLCTGTLIHSQWVLTAAHCVEGESGNIPVFSMSPDIIENAAPYVFGDMVVPHPQYDGFTYIPSNDMALIRLVEPLKGVDIYPVPTMPLNCDLIDADVKHVGYGVTNLMLPDSGTKRSVDRQITTFDGTMIIEYYDGTGICSGDSGGPTLHEINGKWHTIGVHSAVLFDVAGLCIGTYLSTRTSPYQEWIQTTIAGAPIYGPWPGYESCAAQCDEDPTTTCNPIYGCWDIYSCTGGSYNSEGAIDCYLGGTVQGQEEFDELTACLFLECDDVVSITEYYACMITSCADPYKACASQECLPEICDGIDNDCDGVVDNGFDVGGTCTSGEGSCALDGQWACTSDSLGLVCSTPFGKEEGTPCNDGEMCTEAETCTGGPNSTCVGTPKSCDDGNACTADYCDPLSDVCDPLSGCVNELIQGCEPVAFVESTIGGKGRDELHSVVIDSQGNTITVGRFKETLTLGDGSVVSNAHADIFITRISPEGDPLWSQSFGGRGFDRANSVAVDSMDNIVVTGAFSVTIDGGDGEIHQSAGKFDIFVMKLTPDGDLLWMQTYGGSGADMGHQLVIDEQDNIYVTGWFFGSVDFGDDVRTSLGHQDALLLKLDPSGKTEWSRRYGSPERDRGLAVTASQDGKIVLAGIFRDTAEFEGETAISAGHDDIFLLVVNASGSVLHTKTFGGPYVDRIQSLDTDEENAIIAAGFQLDEQGDAIAPQALIYKLDSTLNKIWVRVFASTGVSIFNAIKVAANGDLYAVGAFQGDLELGETSQSSNEFMNAFALGLDSAGTTIWSAVIGGTGEVFPWDMELTDANELVVAGRFDGILSLFDGAMESAGHFDGFLVTLQP